MNLETAPFSPFTLPQAGRTSVPQEPGLGCDPDEALIARYRVN